MCYKPYMRKWMSDRLKRRKKNQEKKPAEPAQAPLQPAYFEAGSEPTESAQQPMSEPEPESEAGMLETPEPQEAPMAALATEGGLPRPAQNRPRGGEPRVGAAEDKKVKLLPPARPRHPRRHPCTRR